jgi:hypothetical protein
MLSALASLLHRALVLIAAGYLMLAVAIAIVLCIAIFFLVRVLVKFFQFRGPCQVLCPETRSVATIRIHALRAAVSSAIAHPKIHVSGCSRWPERRGCDQECLPGFRLQPRALVTRGAASQ